jgi:hypothetical protein
MSVEEHNRMLPRYLPRRDRGALAGGGFWAGDPSPQPEGLPSMMAAATP